MNHRIPNEFNQSDKIGNLSMPQIAVLGIAATIFVLVVLSIKSVVAIIVSFLAIFLTAAAFMFVRINKIPLYQFVIVYAIYSGIPKLLVYRSDNVKYYEEEEDLIMVEDRKYVKAETKKKKTVAKKGKNPSPKKPTTNRAKRGTKK